MKERIEYLENSIIEIINILIRKSKEYGIKKDERGMIIILDILLEISNKIETWKGE